MILIASASGQWLPLHIVLPTWGLLGDFLDVNAAFEFALFAQFTFEDLACGTLGQGRQKENSTRDFMASQVLAAKGLNLGCAEICSLFEGDMGHWDFTV